MKYTTLYAVFFDDMVDYMYVKDDIIETYLDEQVADDGSDFEDVMRDLFSEWCADEYGWPWCDSLLELLDDGTWNKIF